MTQETIDEVNAGVRAHGIGYLRDMASREPGKFLELLSHVLEETDAPRRPRLDTVQFVYTQQPRSDNRT